MQCPTTLCLAMSALQAGCTPPVRCLEVRRVSCRAGGRRVEDEAMVRVFMPAYVCMCARLINISFGFLLSMDGGMPFTFQ